MSNATVLQDASPSRAVIERVAAREGVDPIDLDVPLFEAINPEALDALAGNATPERNQTSVDVEFTYYGYDVRVASDGSVTVTADG